MKMLNDLFNSLHKITALVGGPVTAVTQGQIPTTLREVLAIAGPLYALLVHLFDTYAQVKAPAA